MKSRKHLKTVLFVASMLAVGTTMGAALLIERQGGGSQGSGKQDQSRGAVGRPAGAPAAASNIHPPATEGQEDAVAPGNARWNAPAFVSWPQGAITGGGAHGWTGGEHEWPEYDGRYAREPGYSGAANTFVAAGPDNTAVGRVSFNRGAEGAPAMGSLFNAVPASLSPAQASSPDVVTTSLTTTRVTPPVPEPAEWAMMVTGLIFVAGVARRRNRHAQPHPHET